MNTVEEQLENCKLLMEDCYSLKMRVHYDNRKYITTHNSVSILLCNRKKYCHIGVQKIKYNDISKIELIETMYEKDLMEDTQQ